MIPISFERITSTSNSGSRVLSAMAAMKPAEPPPRTITLLTGSIMDHDYPKKKPPGKSGRCWYPESIWRSCAAASSQQRARTEPKKRQRPGFGHDCDDLNRVDARPLRRVRPRSSHRRGRGQSKAGSGEPMEHEIVAPRGAAGIDRVLNKGASECSVDCMFLGRSADRVVTAATIHPALDVNVNVIGRRDDRQAAHSDRHALASLAPRVQITRHQVVAVSSRRRVVLFAT